MLRRSVTLMRIITMRIVYYIAIAFVFLMRSHLSLTRAFDPDEFAHLHWAYLLLSGHVPYRDFFFIIIPAFQVFLFPIFLLGQSALVPVAARLLQLALFVFTAILVYRVSLSFFKKQSGALLSVLIFISFPMTIDKTIDIRPDMLMVAMLLLAMLSTNSLLFGFFTGLSLVIHPKIIFAVPMLVYLFAISSKKQRIVPAVIGFVVPILLFFFYLAYQQVLPAAYTSIFQDSVVANTGKGHFSPFLALSPFPLVYLTEGGVSLPWIVNTAIWVFAAIGLVSLWKKQRKTAIAMILYFAFGIGLLFIFPVPFIQYFIPLTVMASILAAYAMDAMNYESRIMNHGKTHTRLFSTLIHASIFLIPVLLLISFFLQYRQRIATGADNREQLQVIRDVLAVTKPNEPIYDMVGSFIFRSDGYYICCHPYGEFIHLLASRPGLERGLRESLIARQTKFLVLDRIGFVFWQTPTPDLSFLLSNYLPTKYNKIYSLGQEFHCQNSACMQPEATRSTNFFTILVQEKYTVTIEPNTASVTIDSKEIRNGQTLDLTAGPHRFLVSPPATLLRIQLTR